MNIPQEEIDNLNNQPVFSDNFGEEPEEEEIEEQQEEVEVEEKVSESTNENDSVADDARIPYSRFEKVNERAIRAEERLAMLEEKLNQGETSNFTNEVELPEPWVKLYGDSDASKEAYQLQLQREIELQEKLEQQIFTRMEQRQSEEESRIESNIAQIDEQIEQFENTIGRKLTATEENAILDIQDEFTQKDEKGNYTTPLLSPDKAFEIYTLRQDKAVQAKKQAKNRVLTLTGANNESEPESTSQADFNPNNWGNWRNKL